MSSPSSSGIPKLVSKDDENSTTQATQANARSKPQSPDSTSVSGRKSSLAVCEAQGPEKMENASTMSSSAPARRFNLATKYARRPESRLRQPTASSTGIANQPNKTTAPIPEPRKGNGQPAAVSKPGPSNKSNIPTIATSRPEQASNQSAVTRSRLGTRSNIPSAPSPVAGRASLRSTAPNPAPGQKYGSVEPSSTPRRKCSDKKDEVNIGTSVADGKDDDAKKPLVVNNKAIDEEFSELTESARVESTTDTEYASHHQAAHDGLSDNLNPYSAESVTRPEVHGSEFSGHGEESEKNPLEIIEQARVDTQDRRQDIDKEVPEARADELTGAASSINNTTSGSNYREHVRKGRPSVAEDMKASIEQMGRPGSDKRPVPVREFATIEMEDLEKKHRHIKDGSKNRLARPKLIGEKLNNPITAEWETKWTNDVLETTMNKLRDARNELSKREETIKEMDNEKTRLHQYRLVAAARIDDLKNKLADLKLNQENEHRELSRRDKEVGELETEISQLRGEKRSTEDEVESLQNKLTNLNLALEKEKASRKEEPKPHQSLYQKIASLSEDRKLQEAEKIRMQGEYDNLLKTYKRKQKEYQVEVKKASEVHPELERNLVEYDNKMIESNKVVAQKQSDMEAVAKELAKVKQELHQARQKASLQAVQSSKDKEDLAHVKTKLDGWNEEFAQIESKLKVTQGELDSVHCRLKSTEMELQSREADLLVKIQELKATETTLSKAEEKIRNMEALVPHLAQRDGLFVKSQQETKFFRMRFEELERLLQKTKMESKGLVLKTKLESDGRLVAKEAEFDSVRKELHTIKIELVKAQKTITEKDQEIIQKKAKDTTTERDRETIQTKAQENREQNPHETATGEGPLGTQIRIKISSWTYQLCSVWNVFSCFVFGFVAGVAVWGAFMIAINSSSSTFGSCLNINEQGIAFFHSRMVSPTSTFFQGVAVLSDQDVPLQRGFKIPGQEEHMSEVIKMEI